MRNWIKSGRLQASRVGRNYLIAEESIQDLIALTRRSSGSQADARGAPARSGKRKLGVQSSLSLMRRLQEETISAGVAAQSRGDILDGLESRDRESREER